MVTGIISASLAALFWGSYLVPIKRLERFDPFSMQILMSLVILTSSGALSYLLGTFFFCPYGLLSGILWGFANLMTVFSIRELGLSKSNAIWQGLIIVISFSFGTLFFHETLTHPLGAIAGLFVLLIGVTLVSATPLSKEAGSFSLKGTFFAILAGTLLGSYLIPIKMSPLAPLQFLWPMSCGIACTSFVTYLWQRPPLPSAFFFPSFGAGLMWNMANVASFFAISSLGISIGIPLTQMAIFITILWGIFYLKEVQDRRLGWQLFCGACLLFLGATLITLSK